MAERPSFTSVIKNRGFRFLWINQILVQLAYNTLNFALIIWVFKLVDTNLAISALILAIYLPSVIFGMFAGVFVDIADKRKIILFIDICLAVLFFDFVFIKRSYPLILINTFLINSLAQFFMPCESSSIPMLVSKRQLFLANSLFSLTLYASLMAGYSLAGPILNVFGINTVFITGVALLLIAFGLSQNLPAIKVSKVSKKFNNFLSLANFNKMLALTRGEAAETFNFIKGKLPIAAAIALMSLVQGIIGMLAVLTPSYLERVLKIHATDASYFMMIPLGVGMITGAMVVGRWLHNIPKRSLVLTGIMVSGILFILAGFAPTLAHILQSPELPSYMTHPRFFFRAPSLSSFFAVGAFILGFATVSIIVPCQTVLQESTTEKNRGKIFSVLAAAMMAFSAVPVILAGVLSDAFGVIPMFIAMGVVVLAVGVLARRPALFFAEEHLPFKIREFLGLGHWNQPA